MTALIDFLAGTGADHAGRRIDEIRSQSEGWLEARHDFIQWLFPLPEPSGANPFAPLLSAAEAGAIAASAALADSLLRSVDTMMRLYGIRRDGAAFSRGPGFPGPFDDWLGPIDHNHLRLTRILRCLALCGQPAAAAGLRQLLYDIAAAEALGAWGPALRYWRDAGARPVGWDEKTV
ncbi:opioid growth factor receptor-related protein [Zavarzinia compransoris]|uniref:opioid growth factor receptor-related protein n=1 Tax=Zavarzinia compransoris TaxID=1264899 RepID=UPI0010E8E6E5|nr:opioid growth factor receptor-related protein [Zavarzinia compransoris]TDP49048.1 opioid growth factor receptor-like protein [Zavarzinia compransoris]